MFYSTVLMLLRLSQVIFAISAKLSQPSRKHYLSDNIEELVQQISLAEHFMGDYQSHWRKMTTKKHTSASSNHKLLRVPFGLSATHLQVVVQFRMCLQHAEWTRKQCHDYDLIQYISK